MVFALRAQRLPPALGVQSLVGQVGEVRPGNAVQVGGELWSAEPAEGEAGPLEPGQKVTVAGIKGLKVFVRRNR
jgi:membrane protein implicated in regulation of membrane protease activity